MESVGVANCLNVAVISGYAAHVSQAVFFPCKDVSFPYE